MLLFCFCGCEDYLSELPTKGSNQPITKIEQLEALLNVSPAENSKIYASPPAFYSTDDYEMSLDFYNSGLVSAVVQTEFLYHYTFKTDEIISLATDTRWSILYGQIYNANLILENVDKVEGEPVLKSRVKADAYFLRAYSYWTLANHYCLPYSESNLNELGLPKRVSTDMEEAISRVSLKEIYEFIESDLQEALKTEVVSPEYSWRVSKATVNAFLSRFYLHKQEYDKAEQAANDAIRQKGNVALKDYNTLFNYGPEYFNLCETNLLLERTIYWQESFYMEIQVNISQCQVPSNSLLSLYDHDNDARFTCFFINKNILLGAPLMTTLTYNAFGIGGYSLSGPSLPEVMLNRAESLLRRPNPDIPGALAIVNELRDKRVKAGSPGIHLSASTKEEALQKVLEERRRELPFVHRWDDIRRFAVNETPSDDVAVNHTFYTVENGSVDKTKTQTYTLPVGSRRYAIPINNQEIVFSRGQITQNTY